MTNTNSATELSRPTWQQTWFDLQREAIELMDATPERTMVFRGETDYKPDRTIKPRLVRQLEADGENLDHISDLGQYLDDKEMELRWKVSHHLSSPKDRYDRKLEIEQISYSGKAVDALKGLMQHYDIPTTLIDFTYDLNVALYFACYMHPEQDGCVRLFWFVEEPEDGKLGYNPLIYPTDSSDPRVAAQRSAFIASWRGKLGIEPDIINKSPFAGMSMFRIPAQHKVRLCEHLYRAYGITLHSLFPDIQGAAMFHRFTGAGSTPG